MNVSIFSLIFVRFSPLWIYWYAYKRIVKAAKKKFFCTGLLPFLLKFQWQMLVGPCRSIVKVPHSSTTSIRSLYDRELAEEQGPPPGPHPVLQGTGLIRLPYRKYCIIHCFQLDSSILLGFFGNISDFFLWMVLLFSIFEILILHHLLFNLFESAEIEQLMIKYHR